MSTMSSSMVFTSGFEGWEAFTGRRCLLPVEQEISKVKIQYSNSRTKVIICIFVHFKHGIQCTMYIVYCTLHSVQYAMYNVHCTSYNGMTRGNGHVVMVI